ncbi:hypothetical protein BLNAU_10277 [Blattamonas nauphoetae]|uniref:Uncharacterized protein n=1 Tax=Blattamonas nauphoetae TaxID=2049346 RepID=A0ABQ9XTJ3_9EUKA|nr:hypothetical protein BLNAU_10277 [Blattamonas nauphoetae]
MSPLPRRGDVTCIRYWRIRDEKNAYSVLVRLKADSFEFELAKASRGETALVDESRARPACETWPWGRDENRQGVGGGTSSSTRWSRFGEICPSKGLDSGLLSEADGKGERNYTEERFESAARTEGAVMNDKVGVRGWCCECDWGNLGVVENSDDREQQINALRVECEHANVTSVERRSGSLTSEEQTVCRQVSTARTSHPNSDHRVCDGFCPASVECYDQLVLVLESELDRSLVEGLDYNVALLVQEA